MARGRDATDVAMVTSFGPCMLAGFHVITEEAPSAKFDLFEQHARHQPARLTANSFRQEWQFL